MDGNRLVSLRKEFGFTQKDLADKLNITAKAISFYELEQREPSEMVLIQIAEIFGVSTDYLLGRTNDRHRPYHELGTKDIKEIDTLMKDLENQMDIGISFHGEPLDEQDREVLMQSIRTAIEINKQRAKEKYTPKKYRGDK